MSNAQIGNQVGFTDARESPASDANDKSAQVSNEVNYSDIASLDARLTAIDAAYYTAGRLQQMTFNDKVYAVRSNDDSASILGA